MFIGLLTLARWCDSTIRRLRMHKTVLRTPKALCKVMPPGRTFLVHINPYAVLFTQRPRIFYYT